MRVIYWQKQTFLSLKFLIFEISFNLKKQKKYSLDKI